MEVPRIEICNLRIAINMEKNQQTLKAVGDLASAENSYTDP
jgi:hypothetical protein